MTPWLITAAAVLVAGALAVDARLRIRGVRDAHADEVARQRDAWRREWSIITAQVVELRAQVAKLHRESLESIAAAQARQADLTSAQAEAARLRRSEKDLRHRLAQAIEDAKTTNDNRWWVDDPELHSTVESILDELRAVIEGGP